MSVQGTITDGSMLLALPLAATAGLVSFLSPCVLPLVPGYLSYVTGLTGVDLEQQRRGRLLCGALLFVAGFTFVFVSAGLLLGGLGNLLVVHERALQRVLGAATVLLGLAFMGGVPWLQRERRVHRRPAVGLAGAPMLGVLFGLGWTPCVGPTLGAVLSLAYTQGSTARGGVLAVAYCLGLGLPFIATALAFRSAMGAMGWVKRHHAWVVRAGGAMLVVIGLLLVTGVWNDLTVQLQVWVNGFTPAV
ncbi:MAG: cytochrome c-type biosis protein [Actinomycetota bacterium]|jgi:cytochrome c-type biogenesis protein|nr:cytochrome c-type biosis protein [Actinomycetota bacterium]